MTNESVHFHQDEYGMFRRCYHVCKHWLSPGFLTGWLVANTITFPVEHIMWDHIWPFDHVGDWLDATGHLQNWISGVWLFIFILSVFLGLRYAAKHRSY